MLLGEVTERLKVHDWKSCGRVNCLVGSNPTLSAPDAHRLAESSAAEDLGHADASHQAKGAFRPGRLMLDQRDARDGLGAR
jgi:hypothetical protein